MVCAFYFLFNLISQLYLYRWFNSSEPHGTMMPCCSSMTDEDLYNSLEVAHISAPNTLSPSIQVELENAIDEHAVTADSSSIPSAGEHSATHSPVVVVAPTAGRSSNRPAERSNGARSTNANRNTGNARARGGRRQRRGTRSGGVHRSQAATGYERGEHYNRVQEDVGQMNAFWGGENN